MVLLALAGSSSSLPNSSSPFLYIVVALLSGGLLQFIFNVYRRMRSGKAEDALDIAKAARDQADSAKSLWEQYKVELADAKAQIATYLEELNKVHQQLGAAQAAVQSLGLQLKDARSESGELRERLAVALTRRNELRGQVRILAARVRAIENTNSRDQAALNELLDGLEDEEADESFGA